jgi:hypothetical protein
MKITDTPKFSQAHLGTLWRHKSGIIARLRRTTSATDPTKYTLYLLVLETNQEVFQTKPNNWEEYEEPPKQTGINKLLKKKPT